MTRLYSRLRAAIRELIAPPSAAEPRLTIFEGDTFITSYPRSGNTWCRMIIATILKGRPITLPEVEVLVPDIYQRSDEQLQTMPTPRFLKSHEPYTPQYPRLLYIVRNFYSVLVSVKWYAVKMGELDASVSYEATLDKIESGLLFSRFGRWDAHVESWLSAQAGNEHIRLIRYEDLLEKPVIMVRKIGDFIGNPLTSEQAAGVVELCTFERLQRVEQESSNSWWVARQASKNVSFFRAGKANAWRDQLEPDTIKRIQNTYGATLKRLGYDFDDSH